MRVTGFCIITCISILIVSCKKDYTSNNPVYPDQKNHVLLKEITLSNLPSPYYHFEYGADSLITHVSFASDFSRYDVFYNGNRIREMRNNILVNHDTLKYYYDKEGKVAIISFINTAGETFRHVFFYYNGNQLKKIDWDHKEGNVGFIIDRQLTFTYFGDGNVKEIREYRPFTGNQTEATYITSFDQYDSKINVDDFGLLQDGFHDHIFLLPGIRMQKNNPQKEVRTGDGINYSIDYTYTYNSNNAPLAKAGNLVFTNGSQAGQSFQTLSNYTYY
jgi:hypothetical protein